LLIAFATQQNLRVVNKKILGYLRNSQQFKIPLSVAVPDYCKVTHNMAGRVTLSFSLRENEKGRDAKREEITEIQNIFQNLQAISYYHPYLVLELTEFPAHPWPTFLADIPLWLTTSMKGLPFELGTDARASLSFNVNGKIEKYRTPNQR
jgi:hypothetical protein